MDLSKIDIHELLPQREPFVMVGRLLEFSMERTVTETVVASENIFVDKGVMSPSGVIENIAQTCATRIGYINKYILKRGIQIGFIGAIRNFKLTRCPRVGEILITSIDTRQEVFGMTLVDATVMAGEEIIARSEMKIAVHEEDENLNSQER